MKKKVYIASSWKNQHAVEMLTLMLRGAGLFVYSWIENNYEEGYSATGKFDFWEWMKTESSEKSFNYDTVGAADCDFFIYLGPAGKDAAAECGICYGQKMNGKDVVMLGLYAKGEDFGLMSKMFDKWYNRYTELLTDVVKISKMTRNSLDF